jgi:heterodisulfide reductase subunit C
MDPARVVDALRERTLSQRKGRPPRAIRAFHDAFLAQIRTHGRLFEFGLVLGYKLRTGKLFSDVNQVPAMLARGKLSFAPQPFDSVADIRRIFDECRDDGTTGSDMEGAA